MTTITHGTENNDENIIVEMVYDKGGRLTARRNPAGELTTYAYDDLDRRVGLTNPLNHTWETTYTDLPGAGQRTTLTDPNGHDTLRTTDWLGRVRSIAYGDPATTPDVVFGYDGAGNRTRMTEYGGAGFTNPVRETQFAHDAAGRMTQVGFDADGMGGADVTVSYAYDAGGLRTAMSLSTGETLGYRYDAQGRLVGMTDFDGAETRFSYDRLGRQVATFRPNGLRTVYQYDRASRLKRLAHEHGGRALAEFRYDLDGRGNRVRAIETLAHPAGGGDTLITHADPLVVYSGSWSDTGTDHTSQSGEAVLSIVFFGKDNVMLTMGEGGNHSRYDVYVDRRLWRTLDGYAPTSGTRQIHIPLDGTGPHLLEIRNRREHGKTCRENTPGYDAGIHTVRFVSLTVAGTYTHRQVDYVYDALSRLVSAVDAADSYGYTYDVAGNRLSETHNSATTNYAYNAANQLTGDGVRTYTYDDNGNLISVTDGSLTTTYTWDRANRMMTQADGTDSYSYAYDGLGNRVQTIQPYQSGTDTIQYLLDMQPGLTKVIGADTSRWVSGVSASLQDRYVHTPHGTHWQRHDVLPGPYGGGSSSSQYTLQDGLGSVRSWVSAGSAQMQTVQHYAPYGEPMTPMGAGFGFTGEQTDSNGLIYLRARYYDPSVGVFTSLDPFEGMPGRPMSVNGYSWVEGNPVMNVDPAGLCPRQDESPYARACEMLRSHLSSWGVNVYYDHTASTPCLPEAVNQAQPTAQRFKYAEMVAIYNAFRIFAQAHRKFNNMNNDSDPNFNYDYRWPLTDRITIEKRKYAGWKNVDIGSFSDDSAHTANPIGFHYYEGGNEDTTRKIVMSAARWGINNTNMTQQSRTWLVLHEFAHIFSRDRLSSRCGSYGNAESYLLEQATLPVERSGLDFVDSGSPTQYSTPNIPGGATTGFGKEYYTEAVTATLWNYGWNAVPGYTSDAGGWYGENVSNIVGADGTRLSTWILDNVIGLKSCPV